VGLLLFSMKLSFSFFLLSLITSATVYADHGPGTSGSGFTTLTAETLKPGRFSSSFQFDWTQFNTSGADLEGVEYIDSSYLSTLNVAYGVAENFQLGLTFGYYVGEGNRELEGPEVITFNPDGITDLWLTGKYRLYQGPVGQVAFIAGLKAPTGDSRVTNTAGEQVEPSATAGTGAWDGLFGIAYSVPLNATLNFDASAIYTIRGERYDYELGNRLDLGACLGWRVCGDAQSFPQVSLVAETTLRHVARSVDAGVTNANTGSTVLFVSPGIKAAFSPKMSANLGVQIPIVQHLNGRQVETQFRLITAINIAF
jgi:hypothetical protein